MAENIAENLRISLVVVQMYKKLLNAKVLNFYVEQHWSLFLPQSWQQLDQIDIKQLSYLLSGTVHTTHTWPLSILALKVLLKHLKLSREASPETSLTKIPTALTNPKLRSQFTKHLKPKKRHEIEIIGRHIERQIDLAGYKGKLLYIVDFGAGVGHLCRHLAFGYRLQVCGIEMQQHLLEQARIIDERMLTAFGKVLPNEPVPVAPTYLNLKIGQNTDPRGLVQLLRAAFGHSEATAFECGFVGLHPCGDLGIILMNIFLACPEIKFLSFAGCCYMKLTLSKDYHDGEFHGYPLSSFVQDIPECQLTYEMLEVACHAIEKYAERLKAGDYEGLRIHSYRAAIETIIVKYWPELALSGLASVKYTADLSFRMYCAKATAGLGIEIDDTDIESKEVVQYLADWRQVVVFSTLRLMLAPLVETILLYDRLLYLKERLPDYHCDIQALFDPTLSPRNHIITAWKR